MGFSRQEYWSGLPFPPPGDLPDSGVERASLVLAGGFFTTVPPGKPQRLFNGSSSQHVGQIPSLVSGITASGRAGKELHGGKEGGFQVCPSWRLFLGEAGAGN